MIAIQIKEPPYCKVQGVVNGRAFELPGQEEGVIVVAEGALSIANRFRTRDRELEVVELCAEGLASPSRLFIVDARSRILTETRPGSSSCGTPVVLAPETSFYLVAELPAGAPFVQTAAVAEMHPLLTDLGTWFGGHSWRPSGGPRCYLANLRFRVGPARRRSSRATQMLELASQGLTDKAIAERLGIGISTVETHWRILRERGGYASRTEAVAAHLRLKADRAREDLEAERDRLATEAWLRKLPPCDAPSSQKVQGVMRSWPIA